MESKKFDSLIRELENKVSCYEEILTGYTAESGFKLLGYVFPMVPPEITSAFGIESVKLPESVISGEKKISHAESLYSGLILPHTEMPCCKADLHPLNVYRMNYPSGYGEDAAVQLHNETAAMLKALFDIDLKSIDISILQNRTAIFENLRRSVRSLTSLCQGHSGPLSVDELNLVFEAAAIFPPETALLSITPLLQELRKQSSGLTEPPVKAMIYGARGIPSHIIEYIESKGIAVVEDDTCRGRRLFDISLNAESEYIFYELLDAYSYRPMSSCTRKVSERYELLYKLLRNYGINLLIFYRDDICGLSADDIRYLRIRMMRDGIDPLVIDNENYKSEVEKYAGRL